MIVAQHQEGFAAPARRSHLSNAGRVQCRTYLRRSQNLFEDSKEAFPVYCSGQALVNKEPATNTLEVA